MNQPQYKDDLTNDEGRESGLSGVLVPDGSGYRRAIFTETTLEAVTKTFSDAIDSVLKDYGTIDEKRKQNLDAYEGKSDKGEAITIPVVKRDANQQLAWLLDRLFSKDPFITVRAIEAGDVQVVVKDENGVAYLDMVTTEDEARALQSLVNYYLKDKIGFKKTVRTFVSELLRDGNRPPVLKVCHEPREYETPMLDVTLGAEDAEGRKTIEKIAKDPIYKTVKDGEPTRIEVVPGDKFFIPLPEYSIEAAPFVFQEFEEDAQTTKDKIARGVYDFCKEAPDSEEIEMVLCGVGKREDLEKYRVDGRIPTDPLKKSRRFEIWLDYPFASIEEPEPSDDPLAPAPEPGIVVKMVRFCAVFDWPTKKFLNCYENNYWHQRRPFFAGKMQERPFSFAGYSTSENVGPFQNLISQLFHLQIQNAVIANMKVFKVKKGTSAHAQMRKKNFKLRPGKIIDVDEKDDVTSDPLGSPIGSLSAEIAHLNNESEKMSVVTEFDRGAVPSRTPVGTVDAAQSVAKMQPAMVLDSIRETISDAVKCFVQTLIQFSPEGISIPFKDPQTKALVEQIISFPRDVVIGQFAFDVTATAEDETPQALMTRDLMLGAELSKTNAEMMTVASQVWIPGVPPPFQIFGTKVILGKRRMMARLLEYAKLNPDDYLPLEKEIESVPIQLLQLQQMMMQQSQIGGPGVPAIGGGGDLSGVPGIEGGLGPMEGQPDVEGGFSGGPPPALPS